MDSEQNEEYGLLVSFFIDTEGYSDRDRQMFVCGAEYAMIFSEVVGLRYSAPPGTKIARLIHTENSSRLRMMCGRLGLRCQVVPHSGYEGCEEWADLNVSN